jgi:YidC/Oxa1 family membrane protein insertase
VDQRRLLLAAALSLAVLIVWQVFFPAEPPVAPGPPAPPVVEESAAPSAEPPSQLEGMPSPEGLEAPAESPPEVGAAPEGVAAAEPAQEAVAEERPTIETEDYRAVFSNRGAQLISFVLKKHHSATTGQLEMVRSRAEGPYDFALTGADGEPSPLNEALFEVERQETAGGEAVVFRYNGAAGRAEKRFTFGAGGSFEIEISVAGERPWGVVIGPGLRNPASEESGSRFARRAAVYAVGEEVEVVDAKGIESRVVVPGGGLRWFGLDDTYFITALIPARPVDSIVLRPYLIDSSPDGVNVIAPMPPEGSLTDAQEEMVREIGLEVRPSGTLFVGTAYWGAKEFGELQELGVGLEETVEWGWFGFLVGPLQLGLRWIYSNIVANYGWAIVVMTALIKLLMFPLTHKSFTSMQKMQEVNPKIQAIRQKYRPKLKDKKGKPNPDAQRKMNEEIMALYKEEGVNPAGGCLPMLLQLPVFFAFYRLLYSAVELRGAPWVFWIKDLSAADPFYILPVVMGASQFLQQKLSPASGDPMQRRIFLMMPIVFTFLFMGFPSGLVLYWLTNNVLTIVQQLITQRLKQRNPAQKATA